jgi:hypothetical protein
MNDDRLLSELGALARQQEEAERDRLDERWDRLAAGTLTPGEEEELKAIAAASDEARETYEAFSPLGADFQARVVSAIQAEIQTERKDGAPPEPEPPPRPLPLPVRRVKVWVGLAAAVSAGVFIPVWWPPLPLSSGYVVSLEGGFKTSRGVETALPGGKPVFAPGSPLILEVLPKQPLDHPGKVKARAFISSNAGREDLKPLAGLDNKLESSESGSVRLGEATMGEDVKVPPGDWILWIVLARSSLPEAGEVQKRLRAHRSPSDSWQALCDALQKEEKAPPAPAQVACSSFRVEGQPDP